jgi:hypothetical protein
MNLLLDAKGNAIASGKGSDFHHVAHDERVVKERPILFSAPMVRALLSGTKTQTRRVVKSIELARGEARGVRVSPNTFCYLDFDGVPGLSWRPFGGSPTVPYPPEKVVAACPYGAPGDRLWVKETWRPVASIPRRLNHYGLRTESVQYAADRALETRQVTHGWKKPKAAKTGNVSPLFMPRWASRITLEVTGVRAERLQDISEADAKAEGCSGFDPEPAAEGGTIFYRAGISAAPDPRAHYRVLWESINGADSWALNPWVWVIEFRRL